MVTRPSRTSTTRSAVAWAAGAGAFAALAGALGALAFSDRSQAASANSAAAANRTRLRTRTTPLPVRATPMGAQSSVLGRARGPVLLSARAAETGSERSEGDTEQPRLCRLRHRAHQPVPEDDRHVLIHAARADRRVEHTLAELEPL